jgi:hypothetical protein
MTRKSRWLFAQHAKFGPIVRIAPNVVSIADPEALTPIYGGKTGFPKGPIYEDKFSLDNRDHMIN